MYGFLSVEAMASTLPFSMIIVASHVHSLGFPGNIGQTWHYLRCFDRPGGSAATLDPFPALMYNLRNVSVVMRCPKYWDILCKVW